MLEKKSVSILEMRLAAFDAMVRKIINELDEIDNTLPLDIQQIDQIKKYIVNAREIISFPLNEDGQILIENSPAILKIMNNHRILDNLTKKLGSLIKNRQNLIDAEIPQARNDLVEQNQRGDIFSEQATDYAKRQGLSESDAWFLAMITREYTVNLDTAHKFMKHEITLDELMHPKK